MEKQYDIDDEIEIDLRELLLELLAYWQLILISIILAGGIAFAVSKFMMVPKYQSTAALYVLTKSTSITSLADIQTGTSLTNDYIVVVKGRPVLEQVIQNLDLRENYRTLSGKVELNNPSNSRILEITVTDENPLLAKAIADEIAKVASDFIAAKMDQDSPTIIQNGYADGSPVSPNILKNTVLGGMAGAFLSIALVVLSYLFNDTITGPEDIEKKLGMNVLGSLPMEEIEFDGESRGNSKRKARKRKRSGRS